MFQFGLFDFSDRLASLSSFGDPLERLSQVVDFEMFRSSLESGFNFSNSSEGSPPPYDAVLVFKILILQSLYNIIYLMIKRNIRSRIA
jgi:hypothetical protein